MTYHDDSTGEGTDSVTNRGYGSHTANGDVVVHPGKQLSNLKSVCNISSRTLMCELNSAPKNAPKFTKEISIFLDRGDLLLQRIWDRLYYIPRNFYMGEIVQIICDYNLG